MKVQGLKPKRRKQNVEDGHDDCGGDLTGLGPDVTLLGMDCACYCRDYISECWEPEPEMDVLPIAQVGGSSGSGTASAAAGDAPATPEIKPKYTPPKPVDPNLKFTRPKSGMGSECPACSSNVWMHSPSHTRVPGKCRYHDVGSYEYACKGCKADLDASKIKQHTFQKGHCRW